MLGLDLFPDYATYTAADIPVVGVLPILPGDYTANALFLTGGNATTTAAMAAVAKDHFQAQNVAIVSADNAGANGTEAALTAALDLAGIAHTTVKGGDNETDAGYQGLMREATKNDPDLLVSLYSDAGCVGTIRGRAALGITTPVITTAICSGKEVLDQVGDDALGWAFVGVQTQEDTPELAILQEILAPALGVEPSEVDSTALGLGGLGVVGIMSLAEYSNIMAAERRRGDRRLAVRVRRWLDRSSAVAGRRGDRVWSVCDLSDDLCLHLPGVRVRRRRFGGDDRRARGGVGQAVPAVTTRRVGDPSGRTYVRSLGGRPRAAWARGSRTVLAPGRRLRSIRW